MGLTGSSQGVKMDTKEFLQRIVPADGTIFLATTYQKQDGTTGLTHKKTSDFDEAITKIDQINTQRKDAWFATGSYKDASSRKKTNVKSKKSLYLDLDCGPKKEFTDQKDAIVQLNTFIKATKLPRPSLLVSSGNGIHVYWTFKDPLPLGDWEAMALGLRRKCDEHDFKADGVCTSDASRILRIPGTYNWKDPKHPKECKLLGGDNGNVDVDQLVKILAGPIAPALKVVTATGALVDPNDLMLASKEFTKPPSQQVFDKCPTMKARLETGGKDDSEPMWGNALHILTYTEDGKDFIHQISDQHPGYNADTVEKKFVSKQGSASGPTGCDKFAMTAGNKCNECPLYGHVKNPVLAATKRMPHELPYGYKALTDGMYKAVLTEDGASEEWIRFTKYVLSDASLVWPENTGDLLQFRCLVTLGATNFRIEVPINEFNEQRKAGALLGAYNMALNSNEQKEVNTLMVNWTQQMQAARYIDTVPSTMGWVEADNKHGFALARQVIWSDGEGNPNFLKDDSLIRSYTPRGNLDKWQAAAKLITDHPNIELQIAMASAFAAPLMKLVNTPGAILALVSATSGLGKTKALQTAQAVWGKPNAMNHMNDTYNAIVRKMGILNNIPAYWDELHFNRGGDTAADFIEALFRIAQGKEKSRLNSNITFRDVGEWSTVITVASNDSLTDYVKLHRAATDAGQMRVVELDITSPQRSTVSLPVALGTFGALDTNYGVAGEAFVFYLTENRTAIHKALMSMMGKMEKDPILHGTAQSQRMRLALAACLVVGAAAANKAKLTKFNVQGIYDRIMKTMIPEVNSKGKVIVDRVNGKRAILEYIEEFADSVNKVDDFPGKGFNTVTVISPPHKLPVRCQVSDSKSRVRIEQKHFKQWITSKYGGGSRILEEIKVWSGAVEPRSNLDAGLPSSIQARRVRLIECDIPQ